mmetsp:Transcript_55007/g.80738  ORF Transcript_55007/g.80738 Transcript_55007/m.80738 type:complete len:157 (+) Transcript_55007:65-535(+)
MRAYYSNEAWVRYSDHYVTRFSIQLEYHDLPLSNRLVGLPLTVLAATGLFTAAAVTATSSGERPSTLPPPGGWEGMHTGIKVLHTQKPDDDKTESQSGQDNENDADEHGSQVSQNKTWDACNFQVKAADKVSDTDMHFCVDANTDETFDDLGPDYC